MIWTDVNDKLPNSGKAVLLRTKEGEFHEGHFLKNANYRVRNVNRWKIYKQNKYFDFNKVVEWAEMPE